MNRIVREHYPASKLPEDLRAGADPLSTVTGTIVEEKIADDKAPSKSKMTLKEIFALRRPPFRTAGEIDNDLRRQRDEWE